MRVINVPSAELSERWQHLVVMGNSLGVSIDGSLIVGVPYAWIKWPNNIWRDSYKSNTERKIGTIAKFNLITDKIEVPKAVPQDRNGAHWGFGINRQKATWEAPRRHDMTGVSFVKGVNVLNIFIISRCIYKKSLYKTL